MKRIRFASIALFAVACTSPRSDELPVATPPAPVAPEAVDPGGVDVAKINAPFRHVTDVADWVSKFEGGNREIASHSTAIAAAIRIEPGMKIVDLGAGTGLFEPIFSTLVGPGGRVVALDISPEFVEHIRGRAMLEGLGNVDVRACPDDATGLPDRSADVVFVCDVYHHFEHPEKNLASIRATLVDGGRLVVVDFQKIEGKSSDFVLHHVRAGKDAVLQEIAAAGFVLEREETINEPSLHARQVLADNWFAVFRRSAGK